MRALELHQQGWIQRRIAAALGATEGTVSRWLATARRGGREARASHLDRRGVAPRLTPEQVHLIPDFLGHGAEAYGFRGEVWTWGRVAGVIRAEFDVSYSKRQVSRLLKPLGWTPQVPITRAIQRDEEAIARWRAESWTALMRQARRERRELVSVMGGLTAAGKVYTLARPPSLNGLHPIEFLLHLGRLAGARLLVIWDGSPSHRRAEVSEFVAETKGAVRVERLPSYAPDLNPVEGRWRHLKEGELRNLTCLDLDQLHQEFHLALGRLRQKPRLMRSFFEGAELAV